MNVTVIGSGVVGLTIAFRLAQNGLQVTVLDQGRLAAKASWAGAGILPPSNDRDPVHPVDHLQRLSNRLYPELSRELFELTGIDNEYRRCGGIYIARTMGEAAALQGTANLWEKQGIEFRFLDRQELAECEPHFADSTLQSIKKALLVPTESQLRNPRHLKALVAACRKLQVQFREHARVDRIQPRGGQVMIGWADGELESDVVCIATGAWTNQLTHDFSSVQVVPIKGHMLLYKLDQEIFRNIINEANRYVVNRRDGHVLVGSSEEEAGWDESISSAEVNRLKDFARSLSAELNDQHLVDVWTGLRPMAFDQVPYVGRHSKYPNVYLATGHFRSGLHLSPATADVICRQILGQPLDFDVSPLRPER